MYRRVRPPPSHYPGHSDGSRPKPGCQVDPLLPATLRWADCEPFARHWRRSAATFSGGAPSAGWSWIHRNFRNISAKKWGLDYFSAILPILNRTHDIPGHILEPIWRSPPNSITAVVYKSHEQFQHAASLQMVWNCDTQDRIVLMISSAKDLGRNSIDEKAGIRAPGNISSATFRESKNKRHLTWSGWWYTYPSEKY